MKGPGREVHPWGGALAFLWFATLTVWWFWPLPESLSQHLPGSPWWSDALLHLTSIDLWAENLWRDPTDLLRGHWFYPHPDVLGFTDQLPVLALVARPFLWIWPDQALATYNVLLMLGFALNGFVTYLLVREVTRSGPVALLCGTLFLLQPYFGLELGRIQLVWFFPVPLALLCLLRLALRGPGVGRAIAVGLALLACWGTSVYYALALTPLLWVGALWLVASGLVTERRRFALAFLGANAVGLLPHVPVFLGYLEVMDRYGFARGAEEVIGATLASYLYTTQQLTPAWGTALENPVLRIQGEQVLFPGAVALALGALAAGARLVDRLRRLRWPPWPEELCRAKPILVGAALLVASVATGSATRDLTWPTLALIVWLALGPALRGLRLSAFEVGARLLWGWAILSLVLSFGMETSLWGLKFSAPFRWLYEYLPPYRAVRFLSRWGVFALLGLVALGGLGLATLLPRGRAWSPLIVAALLGLALFELRPPALERVWLPSPLETQPAVAWLRDHPGGAVLNLPGRGGGDRERVTLDDEARYLYATRFHRHPIVNGMSGFFPPFHEEVLLPVFREFPHPEATQILRRLGVQYLHVHGAKYRGSTFARILSFLRQEKEEFEIVFQRDRDLVARVRRAGPAPGGPPLEEPPDLQLVSWECRLTALGHPIEGPRSDLLPWLRWTSRRSQEGREWLQIDCPRELEIQGFAFEMGVKTGEYPRGLRIEKLEADGSWSVVLDEPDAADYSRLIFCPRETRLWRRFPRARARSWRIVQTGHSAVHPWSFEALYVIPATP
jgi:hypothetical protein